MIGRPKLVLLIVLVLLLLRPIAAEPLAPKTPTPKTLCQDPTASCIRTLGIDAEGKGPLKTLALRTLTEMQPNRDEDGIGVLVNLASNPYLRVDTRLAALKAIGRSSIDLRPDDYFQLTKLATGPRSSVTVEARDTISKKQPTAYPQDVEPLIADSLANMMGETKSTQTSVTRTLHVLKCGKARDFGEATSLARMISSLRATSPSSWSDLKGPIKNAINCVPPENHGELLGALTGAYAVVADTSASAAAVSLVYMAKAILTSRASGTACNISGSSRNNQLTEEPSFYDDELQSKDLPEEARRPWPLVFQEASDNDPEHSSCFFFDEESRSDAAVALLSQPGLMDAHFSSIAPSFISDGNAKFIAKPAFLRALLFEKDGKTLLRGDAWFGYRLAIGLGALSEFVRDSSVGDVDKHKAAGLFIKLFKDFQSFAKTQYSDQNTEAVDDNLAAEIAEVQSASKNYDSAIGSIYSFAEIPVNLESLRELELRSRLGPFYRPFDWINKHRLLSGMILLALLWLATVAIAPITLLRLEPLLTSLSSIEFIERILNLAFLILLLRSPYVQDAWIRKHRRHAGDSPDFQFLRSYFPLPVVVQEQLSEKAILHFKPTPDVLKNLTSRRSLRWLISGEGGIGKTSLATYIASLALDDDPKMRLFSHVAVPVFLNADLDLGAMSTDQFLDLVIAKLDASVVGDMPLSRSFALSLFRSKRLLLIVDGMSEMSSSVCDAVKQFLLQGDCRAVVITSRSETIVGQLAVITIRPQKIDNDNLEPFLKHYSASHGLSFRGPVVAVSKRLHDMSPRSVTPLLVVLFLRMMADQKTNSLIMSDSLRVPSLMRAYVGYLNEQLRVDKIPIERVLIAAKMIAHLGCVESQTYRSSAIDASDARSLLEKETLVPIEYLYDRLSLLHRVDQGKLRFNIDSICEYLAGYRLADIFCDQSDVALDYLRSETEGEQTVALGYFIGVIQECICAELAEYGELRIRSGKLKSLSVALKALVPSENVEVHNEVRVGPGESPLIVQERR